MDLAGRPATLTSTMPEGQAATCCRAHRRPQQQAASAIHFLSPAAPPRILLASLRPINSSSALRRASRTPSAALRNLRICYGTRALADCQSLVKFNNNKRRPEASWWRPGHLLVLHHAERSRFIYLFSSPTFTGTRYTL